MIVYDLKTYKYRRFATMESIERSRFLAIIEEYEPAGQQMNGADCTDLIGRLERYKEGKHATTEKQERLLPGMQTETDDSGKHRAGNRTEM